MCKCLSGTIKLSQDLARLVNNRLGSDVQFKVGGSETIMYAHSVILRCRSSYFAAMFEDDKGWKERSSGLIRKPNISPGVLHEVLYHIYTGGFHPKFRESLLELIAAAEEMELEELSIKYQAEVMNLLKHASRDKYEDDDGNYVETDGDELAMNNGCLPFGVAVRRLLLPALILAYEHSLSEFFEQLFDYTVDNIEEILGSMKILAAFLDGLPAQIFQQIISSNLLPLSEADIFDLALKWACRQVKVLKPAIESQLRINAAGKSEDKVHFDMSNSSINIRTRKTLVPAEQLEAVKAELEPLLLAIRFTDMKPKEYARIEDLLQFFLPARRSFKLQQFFSPVDRTKNSSTPEKKVKAKIRAAFRSEIIDSESSRLLRGCVLDAGGIDGAQKESDLLFKLLFRASVHGFEATTFHQRCDNKGPTLVIVKSLDGHIFGGVNFQSWTSLNNHSTSTTNFLYSLKDGLYREGLSLFKIIPKFKNYAVKNLSDSGPTFGFYELHIPDHADFTVNTHVRFNGANAYEGIGITNTALTGEQRFSVENYEVFSIVCKHM